MDFEVFCKSINSATILSGEMHVSMSDVDTAYFDEEDIAECVSIETYLDAHNHDEIASQLDESAMVEELESRGYDVTMGGEK
ncbi:MAG: hypothetical protein KAS32_18945 [Candidatus Peribacteraceae bacterium]|nr:hypothetical protein [Candidatus Peribacteraceae bacterium]